MTPDQAPPIGCERGTTPGGGLPRRPNKTFAKSCAKPKPESKGGFGLLEATALDVAVLGDPGSRVLSRSELCRPNPARLPGHPHVGLRTSVNNGSSTKLAPETSCVCMCRHHRPMFMWLWATNKNVRSHGVRFNSGVLEQPWARNGASNNQSTQTPLHKGKSKSMSPVSQVRPLAPLPKFLPEVSRSGKGADPETKRRF